MRPVLLDLFCGAGGAGMGYHRAGFTVVGVDIRPQPHYPFPFIQADALTLDFRGFDAIHASPPCQRWTHFNRPEPNQHPDLITPLRPRLQASGLPWVIENVPAAPLRRDLILCGSQFGLTANGRGLRRHRIFESNVPLPTLVPPCNHALPRIWDSGHGANMDYRRRHGGSFQPERREAFGVDWMNREELAEALPPAYTELVGGLLLQVAA